MQLLSKVFSVKMVYRQLITIILSIYKNFSLHVDFMVGTEDLSIIGTTKDGREVTVFENGRFAL